MSERFLIFSPIGVQSGGAEALHQLCDGLNKLNQRALLVPFGKMRTPHPAYSNYLAPILANPRFRTDDIVILPEVVGRLPRKFDLMIPKQIFVWWLSIDNASHPVARSLEERSRRLHPDWGRPSKMNRGRAITAFQSKLKVIQQRVDLSKYAALAQSDYAQTFLREKFGLDALIVGDYINTRGIEGEFHLNPKPVVLFNPFKGKELTDLLIARLPEYEFKPIRNMTKYEVSEAMYKADLYLDLGHFPGRDRLAREAVIQRCPILIAKRGAGRNETDFNLPDKFKVDVNESGPSAVIVKMRRIISERESANTELKSFREEISNDFTFFMGEVRGFINSI